MTNEVTEPEPHHLRSASKVLLIGSRIISYLVYFYVLLVEFILLLGFLLLLLGANASSGFVEWAYRNLDRAMKPFRGIFAPIDLGTAGSNEIDSIFDTSVVFAMIIYALIGIAIYALITWLTQRLHRIEREERDEHLRQEFERLQAERLDAERQRAAMLAGGTPSATPPPAPHAPAPGGTPPPPPPQTPLV